MTGSSVKYAAFLLGINLGKRSVRMAELKALLESLGCGEVKTVLASGNVIFAAKKIKPEMLEEKLEAALEKNFGFEIGVIVRPMSDIEAMTKSNPFKNINVTKDIRRYVTFLAEKPKSFTPPKPTDRGYRILEVATGEVYSVLDLSKFSQTPDVMKFVRAEFGKRVTTRNWNTIEKIAKLA